VILVGNVLALALQAVVARRTVVARGPGSAGDGSGWTVSLTVRCAVIATAIGLVAALPLTPELLEIVAELWGEAQRATGNGHAKGAMSSGAMGKRRRLPVSSP
jgi:hypothetical protein